MQCQNCKTKEPPINTFIVHNGEIFLCSDCGLKYVKEQGIKQVCRCGDEEIN